MKSLPRDDRLTDAQKYLASRPDVLAIRVTIARSFGRRHPRWWDEIDSAASWGLVKAARRWRDGAGLNWPDYARMQVNNAVRGLLWWKARWPGPVRFDSAAIAAFGEQVVSGWPGPEEQAMSADEWAALRASILRVVPGGDVSRRHVARLLELVYVEGRSVKESARILGRSSSTVEQLFRATHAAAREIGSMTA